MLVDGRAVAGLTGTIPSLLSVPLAAVAGGQLMERESQTRDLTTFWRP